MQAYNIIDKHIHLLSQTIAKFNRSFVTAKSDDSHTNLSFDFLGKKIWGRWAAMGEKTLALSLNLDLQRFELVDKDYQIIQNFETIEKTKIAVGDLEFKSAGKWNWRKTKKNYSPTRDLVSSK